MDIRIEKGTVKGKIQAPPSKSYAHRMLICAALASGNSIIHGISGSEDMLATIDCICALGRNCVKAGSDVTLSGSSAGSSETAPVFKCRESGSTLRFFIPIAMALTEGGTFCGSRRLIERGITVYEEAFENSKVSISTEPEQISISGRLAPGTYRIRGDVSSQFVSGLLFALPLLEDDSDLYVIPPVESRAYIDITLDSMKLFNVEITEPEPNHFHIQGGQHYKAAEVSVEADWSNAAFLYALKELHHAGDSMNIEGLRYNSLQGDKVCLEYFEKIRCMSKEILDISDCPDLGPVLFAYAAAAGGGRFSGIRRLRIKESDRVGTMIEELLRFGIHTSQRPPSGEEDGNYIEILPGTLKVPSAPLCGHNDHRIVMALSVLLTLTGGIIKEAEAVNKSYPGFFDDLRSLGITVQSVNLSQP